MFEDVEKELEEKARPTTDEDKLIVTDIGRQERWLAKRSGRITASTLPNLMKPGRGKGVLWGKEAKKVLYPIKYERRTGLVRESKDYIKNFIFGHENEIKAIEWLKKNGHEIKSCSDDFEEIVFLTPFDGFGDSPDFLTDDGVGVGEIKCTVDQGKFEELRDLKAIHDKTEYYWQFLGHFIGFPDAKYLMYVIYDTFSDDAVIITMDRIDHEANIAKLTDRIKTASWFVGECLAGNSTIAEINEYLNDN